MNTCEQQNKPFAVRISMNDFKQMDELIKKGRVVNRSEFIRGAVGLALSLTTDTPTESMIINYGKVGAVGNLDVKK